MEKSYIPKINEDNLCDGFKFCSVRKDKNGFSKVGVKYLNGNIKEEYLKDIINSDTYNNKEIVRVYSSGHVFLSDNKDEVFLITTQKDGKIQHQFTGGSPLEEKNKQVIFKKDGVYKFNIEKIRQNARIRTKNRTGVDIIEEYNKKPIVDWVLMENEKEGKTYYKLVCLMHFIVKKYEGNLSSTGKENSILGAWYKIDSLKNTKNIAPNIYIVTNETILKIKLEKNIKNI